MPRRKNWLLSCEKEKKGKGKARGGSFRFKRVESGRNRRKLSNNAFKYLAIERGLKEGNQDMGEMEMREVGGFNLATFPLILHSSGWKQQQQQQQTNKGHFTFLSWVLNI